MAGSFANYTENKVLDHITGKTAFTMPSVWIGLSTADPLDDASGLAEPSGGSYVRKSTVGGDWDAAAAGATANANVITFVTATGDWGTISHFGLFDAASAGNMLAHGDLTTAKPVGSGDTAKFNVGDIDLTLD